MPTTKQSIFNRAAKHLLNQMEKSISPASSMCMYRGPRGLKCAIGVLIPDCDYDSKMERGLDHLVDIADDYGLKIPKYFKRFRSFLAEIQLIHDRNEPNQWRKALEKFAEAHNLTMPV